MTAMIWPPPERGGEPPVTLPTGERELASWARPADQGAMDSQTPATTTGGTSAGWLARGNPEQVHQIVYRWADPTLTGIRGVGPVATSLARGELERWDGQLRESVWAATADPPADTAWLADDTGTSGTGPNAVRAAGYAYLLVPAGAAIIRKTPTVDGDGRPGSTFAHVLVGSPEQLTVATALGLYAWAGWLGAVAQPPAGGRLLPLELSGLIGAAQSGIAQLDEPHRQLRSPISELITTVVDTVFASPAAPVTIVGTVPAPLTVVYALVSILGSAGGPWTFGTRERTDLGAAAPRLVLLAPGADLLAADQDRRRVNANQRPPAHPEARFARALVREFIRAGGAGMVALQPARPVTVAADVAAWEQQVSVAPGILPGDVADAGRRLLGDAPRPEDRELFEAQNGAFAHAGLGWLPDAALIELATVVLARLTASGKSGMAHGQRLAANTIGDVAVDACLNGPYPDRQPVLDATAALSLPPPLVRARLEAHLARPATLEHRLDLLRIMDVLGCPIRSDDRLAAAMFADLSGPRLLDLAVRLAGEERYLAMLLAEVVAVRRDPALAEMRRDNALPLRRYLSQLARVLGSDPAETTRLFTLLFGGAYGRWLPARVVREILAVAQETTDDPLLWVAQRLARGRVRREVERTVVARQPQRGRTPPAWPGVAQPTPPAGPSRSDPPTGSPS
jgi:hypothetical protein